jgi:hypothetical protein
MPGTSYIPARESDLVSWAGRFSTKTSADPTAYGLTEQQTTELAALNSAYAAAYAAANDPETNSHANVVAKNAAKEALIEEIRKLAGIVQADPDVTDNQKAALGLTVHDDEPTPAPIPAYAPGIKVVRTYERRVTLQLEDVENPDSRGKPPFVDGAAVFSHIGSTPPALGESSEWTFEGITGRTMTEVVLPPDVPSGATAWFTAFWFNTRKQSGPPALAVSIQVPGSLPKAA